MRTPATDVARTLGLFAVVVLCCLFAQGCSRAAEVEARDASFDSQDAAFLTFGRLIPVEASEVEAFTNPHDVAAHAVRRCTEGKTSELLLEMPHVETDPGLGKVFVTYLKEFGPDLERYKGQSLSLKFHGYRLNESTSVWYYFLAHPDGTLLDGKPWVSLHRSRSSGRCALTGIFLVDPGIDSPGEMPKGLVTSLR